MFLNIYTAAVVVWHANFFRPYLLAATYFTLKTLIRYISVYFNTSDFGGQKHFNSKFLCYLNQTFPYLSLSNQKWRPRIEYVDKTWDLRIWCLWVNKPCIHNKNTRSIFLLKLSKFNKERFWRKKASTRYLDFQLKRHFGMLLSKI